MLMSEAKEKRNQMNYEQVFLSQRGRGRNHGDHFHAIGNRFAPVGRFSKNYNASQNQKPNNCRGY